MKIKAMNAKTGTQELLTDPNYIFEPKLDGYRALCYVNKGVKFLSRNDLNLTPKYPELEVIRKNIKAKTCILDGEIVALDKKGKPNFSALQQGMPTIYVVFDILMKDGKSLVSLPLLERKKILAKTVRAGKYIKKSPYTKDGKKLWKEIIKGKGEGVMAKEAEGKYYPGKRSTTWLKIKKFNTIDCIVVGYIQKKRKLSSLALGLYNNEGKLQYIGNVGTGFSDDEIEELYTKFSKIKVQKKLIADTPKNIIWIKPKYVAEIQYAEITPYDILRAPSFIRLRSDKKPKSCTVKDQLKQ